MSLDAQDNYGRLVLLSTPRAPGRGGALDLNMAPPAAAATERAGPHLLTGPGTLSATQVSQTALLEAIEGHLSQDRENDRGGSDRSFTIAGLDARRPAQSSGPQGDLKPPVFCLKLPGASPYRGCPCPDSRQ